MPDYGFFDTYVCALPKGSLPVETGKFIGAVSKEGSDVPGASVDYIWNLVKNNALGAYIHRNDWNQSTKYNLNLVPYEALDNGDGTWTLISIWDRYRTSEDPNGVVAGKTNWPVWVKGGVLASVKLPVPPVKSNVPAKPIQKTANINYHFDVKDIALFEYESTKKSPSEETRRSSKSLNPAII
ncbi:hypothetical protein [uncultured Limosilactobacillus sp.]|uniref:hypothetical protein n=1 Tax=uncultured Limosilactobacillus sp. TaxID=2837629 RepID=UPI0025DAE92F|nr:hypothetical protein [uncultured Limosilactobacillus sp.]